MSEHDGDVSSPTADGVPFWVLTPQQLADLGIPVEVALRARIEECDRLRHSARFDQQAAMLGAIAKGLRDALAIIEAKR